jgi:hypothetical protein
MIDAISARKVLDGVRGLPRVDTGRLAALVARFSWLISDLASEIAEIDVNPLIVDGVDASAVDALIVRKPKPAAAPGRELQRNLVGREIGT